MIYSGHTWSPIIFQQINSYYALSKFNEFGFYVELSKFGIKEIKYLGYILNKKGIRSDPSKIAIIRNMPIPHDIANLCSFHRVINYYGQFIKNMDNL